LYPEGAPKHAYKARRPIVLIDEYDTPYMQLLYEDESEGVSKEINEKREYIGKTLSAMFH
jgi:hypothetical protein